MTRLDYMHEVYMYLMGGMTQGCPYPISQIFYPPISHIPDFFYPNIPYPRFFTPQYPISQISQSIDHIPDFARLECVCIHSFDIQLVRMDPICCWIYLLLLSIYMYMGIWNCMYTIQIYVHGESLKCIA